LIHPFDFGFQLSDSLQQELQGLLIGKRHVAGLLCPENRRSEKHSQQQERWLLKNPATGELRRESGSVEPENGEFHCFLLQKGNRNG
jgi:hypothetical protein